MNVFARFYDRLVKTNDINPQTGLPQFKEVCFVEIRIKNNMTDVVDQPATPEKIARFKAEYQLYLNAKEKTKNGTDLKAFAFLTPLEIASLNMHGIYTVEEFSSLDKNKVLDLGLQEEHEKAQSFLRVNKNHTLLKELEEENARLKKEISALKEAGEKPLSTPKKRKKSTPKAGTAPEGIKK